jgi:hypothetical protein
MRVYLKNDLLNKQYETIFFKSYIKPMASHNKGIFDLFDSSAEQVKELKKQNEALIRINNDLRKELSEHICCAYKEKNIHTVTTKQSDNNGETPHAAPVSAAAPVPLNNIKIYVADMLAKKECNLSYIPDFIERRLYENMFGMFINLLDHVLSTASINIMDYQIKSYVEPCIINNHSKANVDVTGSVGGGSTCNDPCTIKETTTEETTSTINYHGYDHKNSDPNNTIYKQCC